MKDKNLPLVSVIIPCRNEEEFISRCLDSIVAQDYPKDGLEVLIIDGMSKDRTRRIVKRYESKYPFIRLIDNPKYVSPTALNIGIKLAKGTTIFWLSAHCYVEHNFVRQSVDALQRTSADCVGGPITAVGEKFWEKVISLVLWSPFGVGNSKFRYSQKEQYVDTLAFAAYRRDVFDRVGLFDEKLYRNQDNDLNYRLRKMGGKLFMTPKIKSYYFCPSTPPKLWKKGFKNGFWNIMVLKEGNKCMSIRHFIPLLFILALIISGMSMIFNQVGRMAFASIILVYFILALIFSIQAGNKRSIYILILPCIFLSYHISYGVGSLVGLIHTFFHLSSFKGGHFA